MQQNITFFAPTFLLAFPAPVLKVLEPIFTNLKITNDLSESIVLWLFRALTQCCSKERERRCVAVGVFDIYIYIYRYTYIYVYIYIPQTTLAVERFLLPLYRIAFEIQDLLIA